MCTELMDNETFDGAYILFPVEKYVVLNNFKAYCKEAKTPTSGYTDAEWNKVSTPEFYQKAKWRYEKQSGIDFKNA